MIVLDRNLLEIDPTEIRFTHVVTSMIGGRVVFDRAGDAVRRDVLDEDLHEESGRIVH